MLSASFTYDGGHSSHRYLSTPTQVSGIGASTGLRIATLSAGKGYSLALSETGQPWVWGNMPASGAIGLGEKDKVKIKNARSPTQIESLDGRFIVQARHL